jgi:hypothetical protein
VKSGCGAGGGTRCTGLTGYFELSSEIPAYIISLLFRTSFDRIDGSWFGVVLRLISATGTGLAIYFGGANAGWW